MAILNEKNDNTKEVIHLMITDKCNRKCPDCCNNQYNINDIPIITSEELSEAKRIYLTGGEPFAYSNPNEIARLLKTFFPNIEKIIVYTNALELFDYIIKEGTSLSDIDGLTISIKDSRDSFIFRNHLVNNKEILRLSNNRLYVFKGFEDIECPASFHKSVREWQKEFVAAPNSIFRRVASFGISERRD